jgi:hypothetical protein
MLLTYSGNTDFKSTVKCNIFRGIMHRWS